jgi:hypothetical protein
MRHLGRAHPPGPRSNPVFPGTEGRAFSAPFNPRAQRRNHVQAKVRFLSDDGFDSADTAKVAGASLTQGAGTFYSSTTGPANGGKLPARAGMCKAVRAIKDFHGLTGDFTFNDRGDPTVSKHFIIQPISGDPTKWAENKITKTLEIAPPQ